MSDDDSSALDIEDGVVLDADDVLALMADDRSLDGSNNNLTDPSAGAAGAIYRRVADANYADGVGEPVAGPPPRSLSNRIFNDTNQNLFSENGVTHWGFVWGQFIDHAIALREGGDERVAIAFDADDPLEDFANDLGEMSNTRSAPLEGSGIDSPRQQVNTLSSYIDAWTIYGGDEARLEWLRDGSVDGDLSTSDATLMLPGGYLPTAAARPDVDAPEMDLMGRLRGDPGAAIVAGDVRANENLALTATHTLFAREHNRIVELLPMDLDEATKFAIARRVVSAIIQYITYEEFLPAMGLELEEYVGYDATVGYRAHSQVHGEFETALDRSAFDDDELDALSRQGVTVELVDDRVAEIAVPLNVAFGNPALLEQIGLGNMLAGLSSEAAYANDAQIDNQLRSVLFQLPGPDVENPLDCLDGSEIAQCFSGVNDLGSIDVMRAADHGMPTFNDLREAFGLERVSSFTDLTDEATDELPDGLTIDDPEILQVVTLLDADGNEIDPDDPDADDAMPVTAVRRSTLAARLAALYGDVDELDAFTGMVSEAHVEGTEFGELQLAMWRDQFAALRNGDRFFYENDPALPAIAQVFGIDYRQRLGDVIAANTDAAAAEGSVFVLADLDGSSTVDP
ncbi:MAG: peroxidase family protein [Actinomycetota bacterium]